MSLSQRTSGYNPVWTLFNHIQYTLLNLTPHCFSSFSSSSTLGLIGRAMPHDRDSPHHTAYKDAHHIRGSISQGSTTQWVEGVSYRCFLYLSFRGAAALPKKKGTKYFISGIKCAFILFQLSVSVCYACRCPEQWLCSALLFLPAVWLIHTLHKQLYAHTLAHQCYHYYIFVLKGRFFATE